MKILVIGGSGLIGSQVIANLTELGHAAVSASPRSGVDTVTGEGLAEAVAGVHTVVDVSNSPSWDDEPVLHFSPPQLGTFSPQSGRLVCSTTRSWVPTVPRKAATCGPKLPRRS
jgi:hypothetical protein